MSFAATILPAVLDTILGRLAQLFLSGANDDLAVERQAAAHMLAAYQPETEDELRLSAQIVSFSLRALEALGQAATPDMPLNKILRLRSGAVSLSRESHKAERRLELRQQARRDGTPADPIEATAVDPIPGRFGSEACPGFQVAARANRDSDPLQDRPEGNRGWTRRQRKRSAFGMRWRQFRTIGVRQASGIRWPAFC
jgi:hypothetical protein